MVLKEDAKDVHGTRKRKRTVPSSEAHYMAEQNEGRSFPSYRERSVLGPLPLRVRTASMLTTSRACPDQRWQPWVMGSRRVENHVQCRKFHETDDLLRWTTMASARARSKLPLKSRADRGRRRQSTSAGADQPPCSDKTYAGKGKRSPCF